jgi:hypothetical protein
MAYETKDNSGSLFKNNRKEKDTHPDYNGSARIEGHDYWISAWLKEDKNGGKYFSFAFKCKDGTAERPTAPAKPAGQSFARGLDDDIPFAPEFR